MNTYERNGEQSIVTNMLNQIHVVHRTQYKILHGIWLFLYSKARLVEFQINEKGIKMLKQWNFRSLNILFQCFAARKYFQEILVKIEEKPIKRNMMII